MTSSRIALVALLSVTALASTGCKRLAEKAEEKAIERAEEKALEKNGGGQVSINNGGGSMTITTDAGTVQLGNGAHIPDDFPKEVPVYPGAKPTASIKSSQGTKPVWTVTLETTDSKDKVAAYYKANLSGFTQKSAMDLGTGSILVYESPKYDVTFTASTEGAKTELLVNVVAR